METSSKKRTFCTVLFIKSRERAKLQLREEGNREERRIATQYYFSSFKLPNTMRVHSNPNAIFNRNGSWGKLPVGMHDKKNSSAWEGLCHVNSKTLCVYIEHNVDLLTR